MSLLGALVFLGFFVLEPWSSWLLELSVCLGGHLGGGAIERIYSRRTNEHTNERGSVRVATGEIQIQLLPYDTGPIRRDASQGITIQHYTEIFTSRISS